MLFPTQYSDLLSSASWSVNDATSQMSRENEIRLHYDRARELCRASGMTTRDIVTLSPKFWQYHRDYIGARDSACHTIVTIHWNLCMGTIGSHARTRKDLQPLLQSLERFDLCGEFMLTEIGHGLDARNIETTATLLPNGDFDLHTPTFTAAKIMPPTTLAAGIARVAVVFAQLIVDGCSHGPRPFIVQINEADHMCNGISSKALPKRAGAKAVDHAVTFFNHVKLKHSAMLGSTEKPRDPRSSFLAAIWRVSIGTLALSMVNPAHLAICACLVGRYSQRREVAGSSPGTTTRIISSRTQQKPILNALAHATVFSHFSDYAQTEFTRPGADPRVAHGIACSYKALVVQTSQRLMNDFVDRLGWQGLFSFNTITEQLLATRGNAIAEGDILVLCIRLASELLLKRYSLPAAKDPTCLLARREIGLFSSAQAKLANLGATGHRGEDFNAHILPLCRPIVEAIAQRMAYEAALSVGTVRPAYLKLFELSCILQDPAWFIEEAGLHYDDVLRQEAVTLSQLLPELNTLMDETYAESHVTAPIVTAKSFLEFVDGLPTSRGRVDGDHTQVVKSLL